MISAVSTQCSVAQSCPTLSDPMNCSPPGSSVHGIFQTRILEWVAISFSNACQSEVAQSCPTLSDPMDCSLPGSSVHGVFQARVLEWGAIAFSILLLNTPTKHFFVVSLSVKLCLFITKCHFFLKPLFWSDIELGLEFLVANFFLLIL